MATKKSESSQVIAKPIQAPIYSLITLGVDYIFLENAKKLEVTKGIKLIGVKGLPINISGGVHVNLVDDLKIIQMSHTVIMGTPGNDGQEIKLFEIIASFDFMVHNYEEFRHGENDFSFATEFLNQLSGISLSTTRGLIFSKMSGTFMQGIVLPIIIQSPIEKSAVGIILKGGIKIELVPSMDYSSIHFGKKLSELSYQDIIDFFVVDRTETDQLELKSFSGNVRDAYDGIIRTICGFLNSSGGLLIWGAPQGVRPQDKKEKVYKGELTPLNHGPGKDQLISITSDRIAPLPRGIRVAIIQDKSNGCVCVFEVDESAYPPHQFSNSYYMRIDGQTKLAPHHYVEALFKKLRYPILEGYLKISSAFVSQSKFKDETSVRHVYSLAVELYFFNWSSLQNEEAFSFSLESLSGWFPASQFDSRYTEGGHRFNNENFKSIFRYGDNPKVSTTILVDPKKLPQNNRIDITLTFGGKLSPAKVSHYTIDLTRLVEREGPFTDITNPDGLIVNKIENELSKDGAERKGSTRESIIKQLLGRDPS